MQFDAILPEARTKAMHAHGYWRDELFGDLLDHCVEQVPDKTAIVGSNSMDGISNRLSYREFATLVDRIAVGLTELGVEETTSFHVNCRTGGNFWRSCSHAGELGRSSIR